jgi:hypothetical protein
MEEIIVGPDGGPQLHSSELRCCGSQLISGLGEPLVCLAPAMRGDESHQQSTPLSSLLKAAKLILA